MSNDLLQRIKDGASVEEAREMIRDVTYFRTCGGCEFAANCPKDTIADCLNVQIDGILTALLTRERAQEREACAAVVIEHYHDDPHAIARAIRARKE